MTETKQSDTLYLFNSLSNGGRSIKSWDSLRLTHTFLPETPHDVTKISNLSKFLKERSPKFVVVAGGDGTVNSVASVIMKLADKPTIAVLPIGFGNALSYNLGVDDLDKSLEVITSKRRTLSLDVIKTNIEKLPYGLFAVSIGFDAHVVLDKDSKFLKRINPYSYILSAISVFVKHKPKSLKVVVDEKFEIETLAASILVANGPIIGKNIFISENAQFNDGLLNCTIFMSKSSYLKNFRYKGIKHPLYKENEGKVTFSAKHLRISGESHVQVDGDATVMNKPIELSIADTRLKFLTA